jgi:dTDP-4-dehydrorhamnose reductase
MGFTDVLFCPLLVNDLARVLLKMLEKDLSGLYHAVGGRCLSKYDFGIALANRFGFDRNLIAPASVLDGGLKAARSPNLTLRTDKLAQALGEPLPEVFGGLERFYEQFLEGYPEKIQAISA